MSNVVSLTDVFNNSSHAPADRILVIDPRSESPVALGLIPDVFPSKFTTYPTPPRNVDLT